MKKRLTIIISTVFSLALVSTIMNSCGSTQMKGAGNYTYETECMGVEGDGSQTLKAWGSGRNREDAIEQAKKNGVRDVLFKGIKNGKQECNVKPVLFDVNIREKKEVYFNAFFADQGPYKEFITGEDGSDIHFSVVAGRKKAGDQVTYGVIIRVQRAKLQDRMIQDQIMSK
ncbi:MAG: hypothetical protein COW67_11160 [Flavobacteriales bacterium CG18_big_fil_WC_8_21_14_2_50_32_9]|nr:MAG: hypothetical protein COW67_11160 [Flavobacteriales bacterium CG18_big_fil_WC_8_21_14_2_50_32_9]PIZ06022.1 MAG: hypothetical protein COY57_04195 [Flavobacteriales bacterium CG_4_10_14_0_8_um_filter_32_5]PJC62803.1 MAG: hypothetical protein CO022_02640 [Flavobacteriales bacterium CG_4_9_14_0_2_um_filter_32_27]